MVMPRWLTRVTRTVINPRELERGRWPVLRHVGRVSGTVHRTPLGAEALEHGYAFVLVYGRRTQWLRNVLAAGRCVLEIEGREVELVNPRVRPLRELGRPVALSPRAQRLLRIRECLVLDEVT